MKKLINRINKILPQTQCQQCKYNNCYDYAEAVANGESHDRCIPGEKVVEQKLAIILKRPDILNKTKEYKEHNILKSVAKIEESLCIGCTKCIVACPVNAIVGSRKLMHTVIKEECTGCNLCISVCPTECISIETLSEVKHFGNLSIKQQEKKKSNFRKQYAIKENKLKNTYYENKIKHEKNLDFFNNNKKSYISAALNKFKEKDKVYE